MNENKKPISVYILKGVGTGVFALLIKSLVSVIMLASYSQDTIIADSPNFFISIFVFVASILIYNSVFGLMQSFDKTSCNDFLNFVNTFGEDTPTFKRIFAYKTFFAEVIPAVFVLSFAAALGASWEIAGMFYFGDGKSPFSKGIIPCLVTLVISSLIFIYNRYEAVRWWNTLYRQGSLKELRSKLKIFIRVVLIVIAYPLALPYLPLLVYIPVTLFSTFALLTAIPIFIIGIAAIIALIIFSRALYTMRKRKWLFDRTRTVVRQHGFEISEIQNPYVSVINSKKKCTFTIKTRKNTYNCLVMGRIMRGAPVCFTSGTHGFYRHRIGTKKHNITFEKHFDYDVLGEGRKILIICPSPKHAYILDEESQKEKRLYNSDKLWDFVVYEDEAFVLSLDRDCLGVYSSVAENNDVSLPGRFNPRF